MSRVSSTSCTSRWEDFHDKYKEQRILKQETLWLELSCTLNRMSNMLTIIFLCAMGMVQGELPPPCVGKNCAYCRLVVDSTTGIMSAKCMKHGYCPEPQLGEALLRGGRQCRRQCEEDVDCPGTQRCCMDFFRCGTECRDVVPEITCDNLKCKEDEMCVMKSEPTCVNSTCSPPCGSGLKCEMDVDPSCTNSPCPLVPRCLTKDIYCYPPCSKGYSCLRTEAAGCMSPPCPKVPQCRPQCDTDPPGINISNCVVNEWCSLNPPRGQRPCPEDFLCCPTICGNRCLRPKPLE